MKKSLLSLLTFTLLGFNVFGQDNVVESWLESNPNVVLIEKSQLENFSEVDLARIHGEYIVFENELSPNDLEKYQAKIAASTIFIESNLQNNNVNQEIKTWLTQHLGVKIIKNSYFKNLNETQKVEIGQKNFLILVGEELTIEDINNYE